MERAEFLAKFGLGFAAVCTGCALASCGSKSNDATPIVVGGAPSPPKSGSGNLFTVDLNSQLTQVGDSTTQSGVILVRIAGGNTAAAFTAVQVACTHQGTAIGYNTSQQIFICPAHGSEFSQSGAVLVGPAALPLKVYKVTVDSSNKLTVAA
jgi:Rieske Fe-S protein